MLPQFRFLAKLLLSSVQVVLAEECHPLKDLPANPNNPKGLAILSDAFWDGCAFSASTTVSLRYFISGLLAQQSMSGYDIRRFLKSLSWLIGSPSSGSLYPILRALLEEGLATVKTIPGLDRPVVAEKCHPCRD